MALLDNLRWEDFSVVMPDCHQMGIMSILERFWDLQDSYIPVVIEVTHGQRLIDS